VPVRIRPMERSDVHRVDAVSSAAFADLNDRVGAYPGPSSDPSASAVRVGHLLATDPGGAWVAEGEDGALCGVALALVREGVWGLSLLVVLPDVQSQGVGRELLARAWAYGEGRAHGFVILASRDQRALRSYVRLGLDLHPALNAAGRPRGVSAPAGVRPWQEGDRAWADEVGRAVRGGAHGDDIGALLAAGATASVLPERGYAVSKGGAVRLLAAADEEAARTLLQAQLAAAADGIFVDWLTSAQQWAIRACIDAGLALDISGAVLTGGELGPMRPYLPSGAYL
jgi:GNAT superfamily N-acetyltransferase